MIGFRDKVDQWFKLFLCLGCIAGMVSLNACGHKNGDASESLELHLQIPEGESPEIFWFGVHKKELVVKKENEKPVILEWDSKGRRALALDEGDELQFQGKNAKDEVIVSRSVRVGKESKLAIPIVRVK